MITFGILTIIFAPVIYNNFRDNGIQTNSNIIKASLGNIGQASP